MYRLLLLSSLIIVCCRAGSQTLATDSTQIPPTANALTLEEAVRLAKVNAPLYRTALTEAGLAREDRVQARAGLLPGVSFATGTIYTQPNGTPTGVFISANAVHEYAAQGLVHQALSFTLVADYRRAHALEALARAKAEIANRGLNTTVVQAFYGVIVSRNKFQNAQRASDEAMRFLTLSQQLEQGGEVAHSDVIKAHLQANDRQREVQDAGLGAEKAKLELAVLIFPTYTQDYEVVDDLHRLPALPGLARARELAAQNNPELSAAVAAMRASEHELAAAIGEHLPTLSFNYFYGIDAGQYATHAPDGTNNLGYQMTATLELPIFNWGATQSKVRQAQLRREQARVELSATQRQALANLQQFYDEARTAQKQHDLLRQSAELASESLQLTTLRYRGGEATALEVVDAQNALTQARNNLDDGAFRYRVAIASLQTLTGSF
jgi:outer membrane protein TolC